MKKILIASDPYETRVAIVEEGVVVETYIERESRRSLLGNVYLARVDNVLPGMEAAFIDAGLPKNGFLYVNEIVIPELDDKERRKKRIQELIRPGEELLVQVVKDPMGTKGARVTMELSFAGRFLVYSPDGTGYGVSKRLEDAERERLRTLVKQLKPKNGGGLIVRTAARGAQRAELERDLRLLEEQWEAIKERARGSRAPALVHEEVDLALEMVRDDLRVDVDEVITDDEATYARISDYVRQHSPEMLDRVKLHGAATPLLRRYQVEEAIASTLKRRVDLPSGGYLLFDYAEAFTVIDVNTGRFVGKSRLEDTILRNNLEAAREVVRQLRLRDIGGMIVIDFIDMASAKNRDAVIAALQEELKRDRSKVYLVSISPLGLVEMTRQNVTDGVREILTQTCSTCDGEGVVLADETIALENLRSLRRHARLSGAEAFLVELHPRIAALMVGPGGSRLAELESSTERHFSLVGAEGVPIERCAVVREGAAEEILAEAIPVRVGEELEVAVAEPHMFQAADAVAVLDGGYRVVLAGAGPYLGETHRVRIERVGRLEAFASLLDAKPVTEEEMLALVDVRTDILEPERRTMDRIDLEDRSRRRTKRKGGDKAPAKEKVTAGPATEGPAEEAVAEELEEERIEAEDGTEPTPGKARRRRRRRRSRSAGAAVGEDGIERVDVDENGDAPAEGEAAAEADPATGHAAERDGDEGADGASRRRRRGRRGGRRRSGAEGEAPEELIEPVGAQNGAPEPVPVAPAALELETASLSPTPRPRRRTRRTTAEAGTTVADPGGEDGSPRPAEQPSAGPADDAGDGRRPGLIDRLLGRG